MDSLLIFVIAIVIALIPEFLKKKKEYDDYIRTQAEIAKNLKEIRTKQKNKKSRSNMVFKNDNDNNELEALVCPYCGAPLKAIYIRCDFCGLSYREAKKEVKKGEIK